MTDKEYKKAILKRRYRDWALWMFKLGISQAKVFPSKNHKDGRCLKVRDFNPYNPLSWVVFILLFISGIFVVGIPQLLKEIPDCFKYN